MHRRPIWLFAASSRRKRHAHIHPEAYMLDVLMIGFGLIFLGLAVGYTFMCDRL